MNETKIKSIVKQVIAEAVGFGFSLGYLKQLSSFNQKVAYCRQYLGKPLGIGSSRIVFQLDDNWVLKLAKNAKGVAQNEAEGRPDYYREAFYMMPRLYHELSDEDSWTFIVAEYILPAKEKDFPECMGISFDEFKRLMRKNAENYDNEIRAFDKFSPPMSDKRFSEILEDNETLGEWIEYAVDYNLVVGDLRLRNLGIALRDGDPTIVLLDNGLTDEIYNQYYRRK